MNTIIQEAKDKMEKAVGCLRDQLLGVRGSGVNTSLVGSVKVKCYGQDVTINSVASVEKNKQNVSAKVFVKEDGLVNRVEKALQNAGLNAYLFDKETVCVSIEMHSQKKEIVAHIKKSAEEAKISVRNVRKHYRKKYKNDLDEIDKQLQEVTDNCVEEIENFANSKIESL